MLDSGKFANASEAKVDVRCAIEWAHKAWEQLSVKTEKLLESCKDSSSTSFGNRT